MASILGRAFDELDTSIKEPMLDALKARRTRYVAAVEGYKYSKCKVVLLGDTPGPARPTMVGYHHTPFYSTKNSSLWVNRLLIENGISEGDLYWFNTTLADGTFLDPKHVHSLHKKYDCLIVCLGGNAEKWLLKVANWTGSYEKVYHPQAWKRFHSQKPYPLIDILRKSCSTSKHLATAPNYVLQC